MAAEKKNVLLFTTFKFRSGTNLSVRRGIQLASKLTVGDSIWLRSREGGEQRKALVTGLKVKRFRDIREQELSVEHDPQCRSWNDLFATMKKLFDDFDEAEIITMRQRLEILKAGRDMSPGGFPALGGTLAVCQTSSSRAPLCVV
jgi:hypothetical protein